VTLVVQPSRAWAGSYLDRAAMLLEASEAERDYARARLRDEELLRIAHAVAEARLVAARKMDVPAAIVGAHPHLMLALEASERALAAALERQLGRAVEHLNRARAEDGTFRALVAQAGYAMPKLRAAR
jgi:hypothetical protein